jgi:hypothetical protein
MRSQSRKIPILWLPRHNDVTHIGFRGGPTAAASSSKIAPPPSKSQQFNDSYFPPDHHLLVFESYRFV